MPIRIKPVHKLGPCQLDLSGIEGVCALIIKEFKHSSFRATDTEWEIYEEPVTSFIKAISAREKLDSFTALGFFDAMNPWYDPTDKMVNETLIGGTSKPYYSGAGSQVRMVRLLFNESEAKIDFDIPPGDNDWLEHFMFDLKKHIRSPTLLQRFGGFPLPLVLVGGAVVIPIKQPYCKIVIKQKQSSPRAISITDNIAANLLYDGLKILLGVGLAFFSAWILSKFGIDVLKFFRPSGSAG